MKFNILVFLYTYQCTSECDICTFSCSPKRKEKMDKKTAKRLIKEAKDNNIFLIGFAGGEPLLFKDEIIELLEYCKSLDIVTTITSNCFWGDTYDNALEIVKELRNAGINHLKISSDDFHNKNIPYENVNNVLKAAKTEQLKVVIGCTSLKNSKRLQGTLEHIQDFSLGVNIIEQTCYPIGRACEKFNEDDYLYNLSFSDKCRDQGCITVSPDGIAYPCGNMCGMVPYRELGSVYESSLSEIIEKSKTKKDIAFIAEHGILPYVNYIKENYIPVELPEKTIDTCHMCYEIFRREKNLPYLKKIVENFKYDE